ncbi:MAG: hypothetical protein JW940_13330 [Polyangiaceae bacterium]|nr:hypothetical protein [Polyangiaceae bacterium]
MRAHPLIIMSLLGAAAACARENKSGEAGSPCAGDSDCKNGFLCEASVCIPKAVAEKARAASVPTPPARTTASAAPTTPPPDAAPAPAAEAPVAEEGPIPLIPRDRSNPPQGTEWEQGKEVNTQEIHSQPNNCEMRVMREWLNVTCRKDYLGYEKMENFGKKLQDYYERVDPGQVVSFVLRLKPGNPQAVRICGTNKRASLFVSWPKGTDRPKVIALGRGPACDGSEWGAFMKDKKKADSKDKAGSKKKAKK